MFHLCNDEARRSRSMCRRWKGTTTRDDAMMVAKVLAPLCAAKMVMRRSWTCIWLTPFHPSGLLIFVVCWGVGRRDCKTDRSSTALNHAVSQVRYSTIAHSSTMMVAKVLGSMRSSVIWQVYWPPSLVWSYALPGGDSLWTCFQNCLVAWGQLTFGHSLPSWVSLNPLGFNPNLDPNICNFGMISEYLIFL
jgi:hypothetical protein